MKVWKLVSGILSMVLFILVAFQSCAAGVSNALENNGEVSGSAGLIVAVLMLAGGIVSVATRKSEKMGGNIALIILFGLAALLGFSNYGSFSDLMIWSVWCLLNAILAVVAIITERRKRKLFFFFLPITHSIFYFAEILVRKRAELLEITVFVKQNSSDIFQKHPAQ